MTNPFEVLEARLSNIESLLLDLKHKAAPEAERISNQLLTVQEAAKLLNLAVPTIYAMVSRQEIPFSKKSKRLYFSKQELTDFIKSGRKRTVSEIEEEAVKGIGSKSKKG